MNPNPDLLPGVYYTTPAPWEYALEPLRHAINAFLAWADTPGDVATAILPVLLLLALIGWWLNRRSSYWRQYTD